MYEIIKRLFDILFGCLLMIVVIVTYPFVAIGIKLSSPGPVMYVSTRIGKGGKPFKFYKYRSMHIDNGRYKGMSEEQKRVFTIGKIIRRTKIDEFPQVINVLKGDLSVVGPRPMLTTNVSKMYGGRYEPVLTVAPGLTSYASLFDYTHGDALVGNREVYLKTIVPVKRELELYYVEHKGLWTDIKLIFKTAGIIIAVVFGKKEFDYPIEYYIVTKRLEELEENVM
ncbi:MAG: sugar transferase [Saccharofermentanales bacterium]|jgi:lipopolysaccharide/colanic/teichoic acid biosynthesis glycosyltransferase